ncbi:MAG: molybdopterin molybdotransferase MoeA, partial [Rhizomicrobium sp.]
MTVPQARAAMLAAIRPLAAERVTLEAALGRILSDAIVAGRDQPPFAASAMDGYAVRSADTPGVLRLAGESAAGRGFAGPCEAGSAIRISPGAALPDGADAVVIQEDVHRDGDRVTVPAVKPGENIRPRGIDFVAGHVLLQPGRKLDGVGLSLAAAAGAADLMVVRAPRVAILSSGDELAAPGETPGPWQIFDSGTYGIGGLVQAWGGAPHRLAVEKDNAGAIARA